MPCEDLDPIMLRSQSAEMEQRVKYVAGVYEQRVKTHIEMLRDQCRHLENLMIPIKLTMTEQVQRWWGGWKLEEARRLDAIDKAERAKKIDQYMKLKKELGL